MSLFSNITETAQGLLDDRLAMMAQSLLGGAGEFSIPYLEGKLKASESDAERRLRVFFTPTWVFAGEPTQAEIDALSGARWVEESPYDYEPNVWTAEDWGYLALRKNPVISLQSMTFVYPTQTIFQVPSEWFRLDKKAGHLRIVPTSMSSGAIPLFMLTAMSGGRTLPGLIRMRYISGLQNAAVDYPDLVDIIKKMAVLRIVQDQFFPQSGSVSADGLSQSLSVDTSKYSEGVENALNTLFQAIHGPVVAFL